MNSDLSGAVDSNILDFNNGGKKSGQLDLITVRNSRNAKFPDGIREFWPLLVKRDAPKSRHGYRIGKDDGIRERDGKSSRRGIVAKKALEYGIRSPLPDPDRRKYCIRSWGMIIALQLQLDIYTTIRRREKYSAKAVSVNKFSRERPRVLARAYMGVEGSY